MSRDITKVAVFIGVLIVCILLLLLPGISTAASTPSQFLPAPVTPEPYPFSDRYPAVIYLDSLTSLESLYRLDIDIGALQVVGGGMNYHGDAFKPSIATVYVIPSEAQRLALAGLEVIPIPNESLQNFYEYGPGSDAPVPWPTFEVFVQRMQGIANTYPELVEMISLGLSVQGRDLWCLKVSDNVSLDEDEPEFRYASTMHGDETTGIEMTLRLAELLLENYGSNPDLTKLVDEIEIWFCPIYNPDGYVNGTRNNANDVNLNRDFPDRFTDPIDDPSGREPETQGYMNFGYQQRFVMGANYHGGELVFNYPWDAVAAPGDPIIADYAPDDTLFHDFGLGYTTLNPDMISSETFTDGLTTGWEWYQIYGGMQDWAYWWHGEHHVTIEVSYIGQPNYSVMDDYWENNRESMLWWMEQVLSGMCGRVLDALTDAPLDAVLTISGRSTPNSILTDPAVGDYHRVIAPGTYTVTASAVGYESLSHTIEVGTGAATVQDFRLTRLSGLSGSTKQVYEPEAMPGDVLHYSIIVQNNGELTTATLTDTLPANLTWVGDLNASLGLPTFTNGQILWDAELETGQIATISYTTSVNECLPAGEEIKNLALLQDGMGVTTELSALVTVLNQVPDDPLQLYPQNASVDQPLNILLSWSGSDANCDDLTYTVFLGTIDQPPPPLVEGLTEPFYLLENLRPSTTYYWSIAAFDGMEINEGPVWTFTTQPFKLYLPMALKTSIQEP
jgi:carboxypeptidase D